ncbi:MAG TPA: VTT domain-containing protein [Stellaceae bacterium]|nr:VTT domain-containing protein [Stellaceae bacterium]
MSDPIPPPRFAVRRLAPLFAIAATAAAFLALGGERMIGFAALAAHRAWLQGLVMRWGTAAVLVYIAAYALLTALSVPGAAVLTIAGGLLFGPWLGGFSAVVGATLGAGAVFLAARAGLAGLAARAGPRAARIEAGFRADAFNYLLVLRLVPLFPFWLVNLVAGMAGMRLLPYLAATFLGIIPGALVYAGLGSGLGHVLARGQTPDLAILFRPGLLVPLLGLALLALLPVGYRRWQGRRI